MQIEPKITVRVAKPPQYPIMNLDKILQDIKESEERDAREKRAKQKPTEPAMGMKYFQKQYDITQLSKKTKSYITLDNGKELLIETLSIGDKPFSKLQYLKDKYGEWIKSKLIFFDNAGKRADVKESKLPKLDVNI